MIVIMRASASNADVQAVTQRIAHELLLNPEVITGAGQRVVAIKGDVSQVDPGVLLEMNGVEKVERISKPYPTILRAVGGASRPTNTVSCGGLLIGGPNIVIIAGPCSVSSESQIREIARGVKEVGAQVLRAGAFKPRTAPHSFQGMETEGLQLLDKVRNTYGLPVATEATGINRFLTNGSRNRPISIDEAKIFLQNPMPVLQQVIDVADLPWIGARNGQSFDLIKEAALRCIVARKPLMLKRGPWMSLGEYMSALEYIASCGCPVVACLRGTSGSHDYYRNIPDVHDVQILKQETIIPVVVDPSHMVGKHDYVESVAQQAVMAGADGLLIETSHDRQHEFTDGAQAINFATLARIVSFVRENQVKREQVS